MQVDARVGPERVHPEIGDERHNGHLQAALPAHATQRDRGQRIRRHHDVGVVALDPAAEPATGQQADQTHHGDGNYG